MWTYHTKQFYANSSTTKIQNANKTNVEMPQFFYNDYMLLKFNVIDSDNNPVDLSGATFDLAIDSGFGAGHALVRSNNSKFVDTDRTDWSLVGGKICCKVDMSDPRVLAYVNDVASGQAYCALWAEIGSVRYLLCQFEVLIRNVIR